MQEIRARSAQAVNVFIEQESKGRDNRSTFGKHKKERNET
jgi:hypothetical protein